MKVNLKSWSTYLVMAGTFLTLALSSCATSDDDDDSQDATNLKPVAEAGSDQNVPRGTLVSLDGSGSSDPEGSTLSYSWSITSKPEGSAADLSDSAIDCPTFTADITGEYVIELKVNDGSLDGDPDSLTVTATNSAPSASVTAKTGPDNLVPTTVQFTLDGSGTDTENDELSYSWTIESAPSGSAANLSSDTTSDPTFTPDLDGSYSFNLVVSDGDLTDNASIQIEATSDNIKPIADAGPDQSGLAADDVVQLDGSGSWDINSGDTLTYQWTITTQPDGSTATLDSDTIVDPSFTIDVAGEFIFTLVVNDGTADSSADEITVACVSCSDTTDFDNIHSALINGVDSGDSAVDVQVLEVPMVSKTTTVTFTDYTDSGITINGQLMITEVTGTPTTYLATDVAISGDVTTTLGLNYTLDSSNVYSGLASLGDCSYFFNGDGTVSESAP